MADVEATGDPSALPDEDIRVGMLVGLPSVVDFEAAGIDVYDGFPSLDGERGIGGRPEDGGAGIELGVCAGGTTGVFVG